MNLIQIEARNVAPKQGLLANLRVIEAIAENITDNEARSVMLQMVKASFDRVNEAAIEKLNLICALRAMVAADEAICENRGLKSNQAMNRIAAIDRANELLAKYSL